MRPMMINVIMMAGRVIARPYRRLVGERPTFFSFDTSFGNKSEADIMQNLYTASPATCTHYKLQRVISSMRSKSISKTFSILR